MNRAEATGGEILNADSVQIYKGLNIGAAKPTREDFQKVPHHLYDLVEPNQTFTAGDYRREAMAIIEKCLPNTSLYVVGGSGFYLQALEYGMFEVGPISDDIRARVQQLAQAEILFEQLCAVDEVSAKKIGPNDTYRLQRALEVSLSEGRPFSEIQKEFQNKKESLGARYELKKIGIKVDRDTLRTRVVARTESMLREGLIDEVRALVERGFGDTKALSSVGYKECLQFLNGQISREALPEAIITSTMQLAKRQSTWFNRDKEISWNLTTQLD